MSGRDHVRGAARATVTLVEYGDFQCPFCGEAFWVLRDIEERFRRDLQFVFRHFPLAEVHPMALRAAEASEAAAAQGKFWEMYELLYQNQAALAPDMLVACANELALDVDTFIADLDESRYAERVREDFMSGVRSGVNGTPCLFINGERFNAPVEDVVLAGAIDAARRTHAEAR